MIKNYMYEDGDIKISSLCKKSFPCKHTLLINDEECSWSGIHICKYFAESNKEVPIHFQRYLNKI